MEFEMGSQLKSTFEKILRFRAAETMCVNGWNNRPTNTVYAILQAYQSSQTKVRVENCSRRAINQSQFAAALFVL